MGKRKGRGRGKFGGESYEMFENLCIFSGHAMRG